MTRPELTLDQLRAEIADGTIDTVVVAFTDMQGRLQGKRIHGQWFVDTVLGHGTEGCNYLLAVDVEMNTVDGYAISSWETGYGDMMFDLDLTTLRRTPGQNYSATVQCDLAWLDGRGQSSGARSRDKPRLARPAYRPPRSLSWSCWG